VTGSIFWKILQLVCGNCVIICVVEHFSLCKETVLLLLFKSAVFLTVVQLCRVIGMNFGTLNHQEVTVLKHLIMY